MRQIVELPRNPPLPPPVYLRLSAGATVPVIAPRPRRVVIISEVNASAAWMNSIAHWLVESGCLYAVAWGTACEDWHDAVDYANLERFDYGDIPDEHFIMTTWHADEGLADALWFARMCAFHDTVDLEEVMILHIAEHDYEAQIVSLYETVDVSADEVDQASPE